MRKNHLFLEYCCISLEKVKAIYTHLSAHEAPQNVLIARADGEGDFKMSCPSCAQKLWVRDSDVDKRGRCPSCKKAFTVSNVMRTNSSRV